MANMPIGPVASTKRKLLLKEQKLPPSRSCVFPFCDQTHFFQNAQNLESATSLIAAALPMRSLTETKEDTPQKTQQSHQLRNKPLGIPLVWKSQKVKVLAPHPFFVLMVCFKSLNWNYPATHPALILLFFVIRLAVTHRFPLNLLKTWIAQWKVEPDSQWNKLNTSFKDETSGNSIFGINESNSYNFHAWLFVKTDLKLGSDTMNVSEF